MLSIADENGLGKIDANDPEADSRLGFRVTFVLAENDRILAFGTSFDGASL